MKFWKYYFLNSWWAFGFIVALQAGIYLVLGSTQEYWIVFGVLSLAILVTILGTYYGDYKNQH